VWMLGLIEEFGVAGWGLWGWMQSLV